jgi:hypothetical protein
MNSVSKFTLALAIATAKVAALDAGLAAAQSETISEAELYQICLGGNQEACSAFMRLYPESELIEVVASMQVSEYAFFHNVPINDNRGDERNPPIY